MGQLSDSLQKSEMRTLLIDIETSPNTALIFDLWDQNVSLNQLLDTTVMLCFAAKWLDKKGMEFYSVHQDRDAMIENAWRLLDEADVVMHYNGRRFDIPHLNREFVERGWGPPSPFQQVDLLSTVKQRFKFPSNKLEYVSRALGLEGKVKHEGFSLWVKCMDGDAAAWKRMERYNRRDVQLLEDLYHSLQPWVLNHPARTLFTEGAGCPTCGAALESVERAGRYNTKTRTYRQYRCVECGSYFRSTRSERGVHLTGVA